MSEASRDGDPDHFLTVSLALQRLRDAAREADSEKGLEAMKTLLPIGGSDLVRFLATGFLFRKLTSDSIMGIYSK